MPMSRLSGTFVALCAALQLFALCAGAQVFTTSLTGLVTDASGAAIPGANVNVRNVDTRETRQGQSSAAGRYTFSQLLPGTYELTVEAPGFKKYVEGNIILRSSQPGEANAALELGQVTETIEVTAAAVQLDTQSANKTVTLDAAQISQLPVNMRNPFALVHATAGVTAVRTGISQSYLDQNQSRFAMNGGRDMSGMVMVDGAPAAAADWGGLIAAPSVDSVQEVQIIRNAYDAEFGRTGSGVVSMVTKGGSGDFHGRAFWFLRNDNLDANSWANNRNGFDRPEFKRHQYGANASGPIWESKRLFFFAGYEALRQPSPGSANWTVPTVLERQGDFSQSFNRDGSLQTVYNPFTTRANPNGKGLIRDPFPGNKIPQQLLDPVGQNVVGSYPLPNVPGDPITNANNFFNIAPATIQNDRYDARVDWVKSEKWTLYGRFSIGRPVRSAARIVGNGVDTGSDGREPRHLVTLGNTFVPTPNWVINVLLTTGRWREEQIPTAVADGVGLASLGLPASFVNQLDTFNIGGWSIADYNNLGQWRTLNTARESHSLSLNATRELGAHSLKFGFSGELARLTASTGFTSQFNFNRGMTSGPVASQASSTTGNSIASLLLGTGSGGETRRTMNPAAQLPYYAGYVQDNWRFSSRLTLNLGMRYEVQPSRTERYNRLNYFDITAKNPLADVTGLPLQGGLRFLDENMRRQHEVDYTDIAPRIGLAYKVTDRLVIRSGYGISYMRTLGSTAGTDGFSVNTPWTFSKGNDGLNPQNLLRNPYPEGLLQASNGADGLLTLTGGGITAVTRNNPTPYVQNYSFDIQYELKPGAVGEIGYTGNQGRKLWWGAARDLNQLPAQFLSLGSALDDQVPNPFFGAIEQGPLAGPTVPRHRLLRRFPQYLSVNTETATKGASSSFNALYAKFTARAGRDFSLVSTYQWSKSIDNASEDQGWGISEAFRDAYNAHVDRSISAHDMPHSFVTAIIYEIPVGRNQRYGGNLHPVANAVIGGWQVSSVIRFNQGLPHKLQAPNQNSAYGFDWQHPNITDRSLLVLENQSPEMWFNTSKTVIQEPAKYTLGNAPRYINEIRNDWQKFADFTLFKIFRPTERLNIQLRGEFFNVTNTPIFGRPQGGCGNFCSTSSGGFGRITNTQFISERDVQLGLKIDF